MLTPTLGLDLPTFAEIKARKEVQFPQQGSSNSVVIFPTMNHLQDAILRAISPGTAPSSDPHLSSLVAAGWNWLGLTLAEPDIQVKKGFLRKRGGKKRDDNVIESHRLYELLAFDGRPNRRYSAPTLWKAFAYSWIIDGNAYFLKFRNDFGQVVEIWYEPHFTISPRWVNDRNGEYIPAERSKSHRSVRRDDRPSQDINYYEVKRDNHSFRVEPDDVMHFRDGIDPFNTRYGLSRMRFILREILGDSAAASYGASLLSGNGVIPYVLGIDDKDGVLNQEDLDNIKAKLLAQTTGENAGQGLVLSSRVTFSRTGLTPAELDNRSTRYSAQEVFSAVTGIPAIVLNFGAGMERTIYNNMSQADRRAVDQYLQPLWWHIAQEVTHQLLRDIDQDTTHFVEFDLSEVGALQEDETERVKRVIAMYQGQVIKRSEARSELNYEVDPGGADDVYLVTAGTETKTLEQESTERERALEEPEPQEILQENQPPQLMGGQLRVANKALQLKSSARQIVIVGGPHTGKTTLAGRLKDELKIANVMHSTDDLMDLGWSEASAAASKWFNQDGDWIIEGVSTARALRKWLAANPGKALNAEILVLDEAFTPLLKGQQTMTTGVHSVFREIEPELQRRGARIQRVKNANDAMRLFTAAA